MTRCRFCGEEQARMLRCAKCKTPYCSAACQKRGWKVHKTFCSDDPAMRPVIAVEHAVESGLEWYRRGDAAVPADVHCFICLEGGDGLLHQGCGCRGTSGFAHPECLEKMAKTAEYHLEEYRLHHQCSTCEQPFLGAMQTVMARTYWRSNRLSRDDDARRRAAGLLASTVREFLGREPEAMEHLYAEAVKGLSDADPRSLVMLVERARTLMLSRRFEAALDLLRTAYPRVKRRRDAVLLSEVSHVTAKVLVHLGRPDEALRYAEEAVNASERSSCQEMQLHDTKATYVHVLALNGRLQEARAIGTKELEFCERVYGPNHGLTQHITLKMASCHLF